MFDRKFERLSKGRAADHGVAVDAVVADALPCAGSQTYIGVLRQCARVSVDSKTLPMRDSSVWVFKMAWLNSSAGEQILHRNTLRRKFGSQRPQSEQALGGRIEIGRQRTDDL